MKYWCRYCKKCILKPRANLQCKMTSMFNRQISSLYRQSCSVFLTSFFYSLVFNWKLWEILCHCTSFCTSQQASNNEKLLLNYIIILSICYSLLKLLIIKKLIVILLILFFMVIPLWQDLSKKSFDWRELRSMGELLPNTLAKREKRFI